MQLGMIGLGRMGANIVRRLMRDGHECVVYDLDPDVVRDLVVEGAVGATSLADLAAKMTPPRAAWIPTMIGKSVGSTTASGLSVASSPATPARTSAALDSCSPVMPWPTAGRGSVLCAIRQLHLTRPPGRRFLGPDRGADLYVRDRRERPRNPNPRAWL